AFVETTPSVAPPSDQSIARYPDGADSDNNGDDFQLLAVPTPRNSADQGSSSIGFAISKAAPLTITLGQSFTYTLSATNHLSATASGVVITDAVPVSATIASVSDGGVVLSGDVVSWTVASLVDGATLTRTIVVTAPNATTTLINSDYGIWADNYLTRTSGTAVTTQVGDSGSPCPTPAYTLRQISAVQGSGAASPFNGSTVTVHGTVTGKYTTVGFFVQDAGDGNAATSDGIFVNSTTAVNVGDAVQVNGTVGEANTLTQLTSTSVAVCGTPETITPTIVTLPVLVGTTLEPYEDMLVTFAQTLTVDQNYFQGRYGQVTLSSDGRMYSPTNGNGLGDTVDLNLRRMIVLDDGSSAQNPNPIPYIGADNTLRAGDTITNLTGVIDYGPINSDTSIRHYRLQPVQPLNTITFTRVNARSSTPPDVGGSLKVASFNVLNYFNGDGLGGGFPTSRGASTLVEFNRQRTKIITALVTLNADVVGLMEIENDGDGSLSAIQDLVNGLNAATAPNTYAFVSEPAPGADAIKVAMIYQPGRVTPIGAAQNYQTNTAAYAPLFDRPPLIQRFQAPNGQQFFVIVNHFKSKGSCPSSGVDVDLGQGCWNAKRVAQANELINFIATLQPIDPDVIVIGDLNSYGAEDPIAALETGGLIDQVAAHEPAASRYSYVFDGQSGYLDHALSTASLNTQITNVRHWHINADEPSVIDYNTEFKPQDLYSPTPYRASDHDPVLIGLNLNAPAPVPDFSGSSKTVNTATVIAGDLLTYTLIVSNSGNLSGTFALTDTLNAALTVISAPGLTQNGATLTGSGVVESRTVQSFVVTVRVSAGYSGLLTNTAQLSGDGLVHNLVAPAVTVQPQPKPDFSMSSKLVDTTVVTGSQPFTYTLFIANTGDAAGTFALTDTLNANLIVLAAPGLNVNGHTLTVTGTLDALTAQSFDIVVQAAAGFSGIITNTAALSSEGQTRPLSAPSVTHVPIYSIYLPLILK
ncbi:MAG TPA: ExeM/NucH family extracellular endonuclease, partial [Anaerolineae bacterium]|nr:ExeM/NucH family extracellular endonuclease [Anaerolineae bacterium]